MDAFLRGVRIRKSAVDFSEVVKRVAEELDADRAIAFKISKAWLAEGQSGVDRVVRSEMEKAVDGRDEDGDDVEPDDDPDDKVTGLSGDETPDLDDEDDRKRKAADLDGLDQRRSSRSGSGGRLDGRPLQARKRRSYGHDSFLNGD